MLTNSKKLATRLGALLAVAAVFVAGCDMLSQEQSGSDALLRVTNDLGQRMTVYPQGKTVPTSNRKAAPAKSAFTLRAVSRINPPNSGQRASHISKGDEGGDKSIFVGYKVRGSTFGGGIDILDADDPTTLGNEDNALRSEDLDVQEVLYDGEGNENRLYVAGAVDFGKIDARDYGNTPAVVLRGHIDDDGNVETSSDGDVNVVEAAMPDHLVKGLALEPGGSDQPHDDADLYAVTDSHVLYSFGKNLGVRNATAINDNDVEFTSVTSQRAPNRSKDVNVLTLGDDGNVYKFDKDDNVSEVQNFSDLTPGGIARLSFHEHDTAENIASPTVVNYAALNDGGLAVLSSDGSSVYYENTDQYYVSVAADEHDVDSGGSGDVARVFAAGPNGTIDVFEITSRSKLKNSNTDEGLQLLASFDLGGLEENGIGSDPLGSGQVNQIVVEDDYLFVAAGDQGVLTLEIAENEGDIFQ